MKSLILYVCKKPKLSRIRSLRNTSNIDAYHSYFSSAEKKGYSDVAIFARSEPNDLKSGLDIKKIDSDGRVLIAEYDAFALFNIYFPNGKASGERLKYKLDFYNVFLKYVDNMKDNGINIIICGDVNTAHEAIDSARPKENESVSGFLPVERQWIDKFLSHGYIDTFKMFNDKPGQYTWRDYKTRARERNTGWRIDYFFVSENLRDNVTNAFIRPDIMGSDHCPIGIKIEV